MIGLASIELPWTDMLGRNLGMFATEFLSWCPPPLMSVNSSCLEGTYLDFSWVPERLSLALCIPGAELSQRLRITVIMDPSKVEAITKWPRPTTVTESEKFSGLAGYYRRFRLDVELCVRGSGGYWASMRIESNLMLQIKETQRDDSELWAIVQNVKDGKHTEFSVDDDRCCVVEDDYGSNDQHFARRFMTKVIVLIYYSSGFNQMYKDLKQYFWWTGMKQDVATFVSKCMTCQQVKIEHQRASGLLQPLEDSCVEMGDEISMDFVTSLLLLRKYMMRFGVVYTISSSKRWSVREGPISDLEDMLRADALDKDSGERLDEGSELNEIIYEKVAVVRDKLKRLIATESYADKDRRYLEFQVGDRVFLKVSPFRGVKRFGIKGKLSP
ncbi:retrotransposon protein, putative, ty3-gypsy subclass [Tanacetum coccineum]|uniref:Retrotransposon protein, putative, ty3-gypsy subclass n=1 Tax=Tanacetum coccineum TaxID=301880 RepID=A0ABQ5HXZ4_9ASTR